MTKFNVTEIIETKLTNNDLGGAIAIMITECDVAKQIATEGLKTLTELDRKMEAITRKALDKYPTK
jgi:hypothetical protein